VGANEEKNPDSEPGAYGNAWIKVYTSHPLSPVKFNFTGNPRMKIT
jgi:hypothetical protein